MEFREKIALVTGGGRGIGKAISLAFAREGADVVVSDIDKESVQQTASEIKAVGRRSLAVIANVAKEDEVNAMFEEIIKTFGGLDILVNNAGIGRPIMVENMNKSYWENEVGINLGGTFNCSRAAIPIMKERGGGRIVNIASIAAKTMSFFFGASYTASKCAILGFTRHLAFELGPYGINVNAVCPGFVKTPLVEHLSSREVFEQTRLRTPMRDLVRPEDIADVVLFLSGPRSHMITGTDIVVDGGISLGVQDYDAYVAARKGKGVY